MYVVKPKVIESLVCFDLTLTLDTAELGQATQPTTSLIGTGACRAEDPESTDSLVSKCFKMFQMQKVHLVFGDHLVTK